MKFARDRALDNTDHYQYDSVKRKERKKVKEFRDKRKARHSMLFVQE